MSKYEAIIGLEMHAQISTKTKMFCRCSTDSFDKEPNLNVCEICMGFPGQLPVINREAVRKGIVAALALNCKIPEFCKFDRKNYFYPDLPKGYQISQFDKPLSVNGHIEIELPDGKMKSINITRLHLEDDAGKLTHIPGGTLCDYNRTGEPLMEIVSEPDMRSAEEAVAYAREIQNILRYCGASDADMEKGMMRFDASVSVREKGEKKLNHRAEIKNLNSFRSLGAAIAYEIDRQITLAEEDQPLKTDVTMGWTDDGGKTYFLREKEGSDDYRYFPEPDLPPLVTTKEDLEELRKLVPEMPQQKRKRYSEEWGLLPDDIRILTADLYTAQYFEKVVSLITDPKKAVSFINTVLLKKLNEDQIALKDSKVTAELLAELIQMVEEGKISNNQAKAQVFDEMYNTGKNPAKIAAEKGLEVVSDTSKIEAICKQIIRTNQNVVDDYKNGKDRAFGFLVGLVMKESRGKANPRIVNEILKKLL
ncbi:Asp-tRNA(Asn)/Glu-tRNA(Gln) amidotransferase subunit GatB [Candidatus Peregrinibacteria bacterium]|nr:Asp-tRNA(Asn)/Glu-tRNA(Gln) amidotransferase subunit GatB [Candidatus Peregrinibacteria bacterium]